MDTGIFINNGLVPFMTALAATTGGEFIKPVLEVFDNWFYVKFGSKAELDRKKRELENNSELDLYKLEMKKEELLGFFKVELLNKLVEIPKENIQIPDQQIVSLVMENIHLYLNQDDLRRRFANLLANSANNVHSNKIHPLFIETIKTMSAKDAEFLKDFKSMPFTIIDKISLMKLQESDTHSVTYQNKMYGRDVIETYVLRQKGGSRGFPIPMNGIEVTDRYIVINQRIDELSFLEKQNVLHIVNTKNVSVLPSNFIEDFEGITKELVLQDESLLEYKKYIECKFNEKTNVEHQLFFVELTNYGKMFREVVLD